MMHDHFVTPPLQSGKGYAVLHLPWPLPGLPPEAAISKWREPPVPDEAACMQLWKKYHMLEHIGKHSRAVANMAEALAHRTVELGLNSPELIPFCRAAGLLHDIAKAWSVQYGGSHAQIGASWVIESTGHWRLAQTVFHHVEWLWQLPEKLASGVLTPVFFVMYADKRAKHDTLVTVSERYDDLLLRYGKTEQSRTAIARGREQIFAIERALSAQLEIDLNESTAAGGRLVKRA